MSVRCIKRARTALTRMTSITEEVWEWKLSGKVRCKTFHFYFISHIFCWKIHSAQHRLCAAGLCKFFNDGDILRRDAVTGSILKVQKILEWFEGQSQLSFYASSLLFVYEGGCPPDVMRSDARHTPEACEQNNNIARSLSAMFSLHKKACVRSHYQAKQDNGVWTSTQQPNGNRGLRDGGEELKSDARQDTGGDVEVKMIDFAHVFPSDGHDQGYIYGLKNLLKVLHQILEGWVRRRGSFRASFSWRFEFCSPSL